MSPDASSSPRWVRAAIVGFGLAVFAALVLRIAWVTDDAYISFRSVDNFVHGRGMTWNSGERVQVFTHPFWFFVMSGTYAITGEMYFTSIATSLVVSLAAVWFAARSAPRIGGAMYVLVALTVAKCFSEYSTSGLENPMTHLLVAAFAAIYFRGRYRERDLVALSLLTSLSAFNRMDTLLLTAPALCYAALTVWRTEAGLTRTVSLVLAGTLVFVGWEVFSVLYYGTPVPNTAYAKLGSGVSPWRMAKQGIWYLWNSLRLDPITLITVLVASVATFTRRRSPDAHRAQCFLIGGLLYLAYVVRIGGDFMSGRFLTGPFLVAVIVLARLPLEGRRAWVIWTLLVVGSVAGSLASPVGPLRTDSTYGEGRPADARDARMVTDERRFFYQGVALVLAFEGEPMVRHEWAQAGRAMQAKGPHVEVDNVIGWHGFYAGPDVYIIDKYALSDPLLARLPAARKARWRVGHLERPLPRGYVDSIEQGDNLLEDPALAAMYDDVLLATRSPKLFSRERIAAIWRLNTGYHDDRIDHDRIAHLKIRQLQPEQLSTPRDNGMRYDNRKAHRFGRWGIQVDFEADIGSARRYELSLTQNDTFRLEFWRGSELLDTVRIEGDEQLTSRLVTYEGDVPSEARGFDRIRIFPTTGRHRAIGHFIVE